MKTSDAYEHLINELENDNSYRISWISNLAMCYIDSEKSYKKKHNKKYLNNNDKHIISNDAANNFLKLMFNKKRLRKIKIQDILNS